MIKIQNGTRSDSTNLCHTCQNGQVMRGAADSSEVIHCMYMNQRVRMQIAECSNYYRRGQTTLDDLYRTAWILETSKRHIGFLTPSEWSSKHPNQHPSQVPSSR